METNDLTAIQIATASKLFNKEYGRHAEMSYKPTLNGDRIYFYWKSGKKVVGKVYSCQYFFYQDRYEIVKHIYNQYGCYWEQKTVCEYPATPAETSRISTESADTVNVSAEGENTGEVKRMAAKIEPYKDIDYCALTAHYTELLSTVCLIFNIRREEARERYGLFTYRQWYHLLTNITGTTIESPQSPETPQTAECTAEPCKPTQTA